MPDLDSTLSSIDEVAVHHCGQCDTPLTPDSSSALFCSPEPSDVPQHIHNQVELDIPETTSIGGEVESDTEMNAWVERGGVPLEDDGTTKFWINIPCWGARETFEEWIDAEYRRMWLGKLPAGWEPVNRDDPCTYVWVDPDPLMSGSMTGLLNIAGRVRRID